MGDEAALNATVSDSAAELPPSEDELWVAQGSLSPSLNTTPN